MNILEVRHISTGYGKKQVLYDVSFNVKQGDIVLLVGSNGSGKSTLLKAIYGLLPLLKTSAGPFLNERGEKHGEVWFNGESITGLPPSELLKKGLQYIPQKNNLFEDLTVKENLQMAGLALGDDKLLKQRIDNVLAIFPSLADHLKRTPAKQSGGERKLLTLAMAMLHKSKLLLIDEPFAGLSMQCITFVTGRLNDLNMEDKVTMLIVEHRLRESYQIANKIVALKLGKVYEERQVNDVLEIRKLNNFFA